MDEKMKELLATIPQQPQVQAATADQLQVLSAFANRLGLYDASDLLQKSFLVPEDTPNLFWNSIEDHIQYAKEIGSNFVGRPGAKWTAFALAEEVERLRAQAAPASSEHP